MEEHNTGYIDILQVGISFETHRKFRETQHTLLIPEENAIGLKLVISFIRMVQEVLVNKCDIIFLYEKI